ncbi:DUF402 domain-containing protein [Streptomyces sp. NPDC006140]|uniref:DUF402 domain-containing protein n=1 Tax=Streptomyces sp. NPDC006140 TaxID=3154579 RepID=UPI003401C901
MRTRRGRSAPAVRRAAGRGGAGQGGRSTALARGPGSDTTSASGCTRARTAARGDGDGRRLRNWYVNFEHPTRRTTQGCDTFDLTVDLVVDPGLTRWEWKDEDEYAHVRRLGIVTDTEHQAVDAASDQVLAMLTERSGPFADASAWTSWWWNPAWPPPGCRARRRPERGLHRQAAEPLPERLLPTGDRKCDRRREPPKLDTALSRRSARVGEPPRRRHLFSTR